MAKVVSKKPARSVKNHSLAFAYLDQVVAGEMAAFYRAFRIEAPAKKKGAVKKASKKTAKA